MRRAMSRVYAGNGGRTGRRPDVRRTLASRAGLRLAPVAREAAGDGPMYARPPRRGLGIVYRVGRPQGAPLTDPAGKVVDTSIVAAEARVALERLREIAAQLVSAVSDPGADDESRRLRRPPPRRDRPGCGGAARAVRVRRPCAWSRGGRGDALRDRRAGRRAASCLLRARRPRRACHRGVSVHGPARSRGHRRAAASRPARRLRRAGASVGRLRPRRPRLATRRTRAHRPGHAPRADAFARGRARGMGRGLPLRRLRSRGRAGPARRPACRAAADLPDRVARRRRPVVRRGCARPGSPRRLPRRSGRPAGVRGRALQRSVRRRAGGDVRPRRPRGAA